MHTAHRRRLAPALAIAALLTVVRVAAAHDFWLVPDAFQVAEGAALEVKGQTSSRFPTSESAVTPDRVREVRVLAAEPGADVRVTDLSTAGNSLMLRHRPRGAGQRVVAAVVDWRSVRASGPEFKRYIELEGNPALAARYEREGVLPKTDSITRRYAKYAKTIVQVGTGAGRAFARMAGHPLEFVPLRDPSTLNPGDTLALRLLYAGAPLTHAQVHAGVAVAGGGPLDASVSSDAQGVVRVVVTRGGLWNVRTIHVVPAPGGSGADWESHFATLVWQVAGAPAGSD